MKQGILLSLSFFLLASCSAPYETPLLGLLPGKAQVVLVMDIDAFRRSKLWEAWEEELEFAAPMLPGALQLASGVLSLPLPEALDTLAVSLWWEEGVEGAGVLTLKNPLKEETLFSLATQYLGASVEEREGRRVLRLGEGYSLVLLDEKTLLAGSAQGFPLALERAAGRGASVEESPHYASLRKKLTRGGALWGFGEVPPALREELGRGLFSLGASDNVPGGAQALGALQEWTSFVGMVDVREGIKGELYLDVASEEEARKLGSSSFLTSAFSVAGMLVGLSQMGSWFTFSWSGRDWIVKLAIPQGEANSLLRFSAFSAFSQEPREW